MENARIKGEITAVLFKDEKPKNSQRVAEIRSDYASYELMSIYPIVHFTPLKIEHRFESQV